MFSSILKWIVKILRHWVYFYLKMGGATPTIFSVVKMIIVMLTRCKKKNTSSVIYFGQKNGLHFPWLDLRAVGRNTYCVYYSIEIKGVLDIINSWLCQRRKF